MRSDHGGEKKKEGKKKGYGSPIRKESFEGEE